jgi:vacuolar-type H+-ATPase subunit H
MKKILSVFALVLVVWSCEDPAGQTDNQKAGVDSVNAVDQAQEKLNEIVDSAQSKGGELLEKATDSLKDKVLEPVKTEAKKAGEKIKESLKEAKEKMGQ